MAKLRWSLRYTLPTASFLFDEDAFHSWKKVVCLRAQKPNEKIDRPNGGHEGDGVRTGEWEKLRPQVTGWWRRKQDVLDIVHELLFECRKKLFLKKMTLASRDQRRRQSQVKFGQVFVLRACSANFADFLCSFSRQTNLWIEIRDAREWKQVLAKAECMQTSQNIDRKRNQRSASRFIHEILDRGLKIFSFIKRLAFSSSFHVFFNWKFSLGFKTNRNFKISWFAIQIRAVFIFSSVDKL